MINNGFDKTPAMQSDHPTLASRVAAARKNASTMPQLGANPTSLRKQNIASESEFKNFLQQAAYTGRNTLSDKQIVQTRLMLTAMPRSCLTPIDAPDQQSAQQELLQKFTAKQQK